MRSFHLVTTFIHRCRLSALSPATLLVVMVGAKGISSAARQQELAGPAFVAQVERGIAHRLPAQVFDPELIETMSQALADACATPGLKDNDSAAGRFLAMRIIKEARAGTRDPAALKAAAL